MLRKITDFIVEKRNWILGLFVIFTAIGVVLMGKVKINSDMMEYLPKDSETRAGLDLMTAEFGEDETSDLTVMFADMDVETRDSILDYLQGLDGVSEVAYDDSDEYNRDEYTRFVLTIDGQADSETAKRVYDEITSAEFNENLETYYSGTVEDENGEVLHFSIIVLAVVCALVILIIMSESFVEPFLFLITILIAVVLNKATNLIFPSISNITDSIVAILQMALSMDYSIMLMNRYVQERETEKDRVKAMKKALYAAFAAISSSSVTTIVGLLALVFMSFTIGQDLGFVLAKGVLFSLIAIFTCLPGLILLSDKLIAKTKKPSPHFNLKWAGSLAHKMRYVGVPIFIVVFVGCFMLKGNLGIFYSSPMEDEVKDVFGEKNQFALIYDNADEHGAAEYCRALMDDAKVSEVLCYGNTIGDGLTVDGLTERMEKLGANVDVDDYLLNLVYYYYYNDGQGRDLTLDEFVSFVQNEVANNPAFSGQLTPAMRTKINQLANFASVQAVQRKRTATDLATTLEVDAAQVEDLLIYYNSRDNAQALTLTEFVNFLQNYVMPSKYGASFGATERANVTQLANMVQLTKSTNRLDSVTMAQTFGVQPELVQQIYLAKALEEVLVDNNMASVEAGTTAGTELTLVQIMQSLPVNVQAAVMRKAATITMTPSDFVNMAAKYATEANQSTQVLIRQTQQVFKLTQGGVKLNTAQMSGMMGASQESVELLYSLYEVKQLGKNVTLSLTEFVDFLLRDVAQNPTYASNLNGAMLNKLTVVRQIMQNTLAARTYSPSVLVGTLSTFANDLSQDLVELVYLYRGSIYEFDESWKLSVEDFVTYLDKVILVDERLTDFIPSEIRDEVDTAVQTVADAKAMLVGENYSRTVVLTDYDEESEETFAFIERVKNNLNERTDNDYYVVGNSLMAYEMAQSFDGEMNFITILTMIFIFVVVAITFKSLITPVILVALIQCAVYFTMGLMTVFDGEMYFIAILIVQSILMGATIDYAILYTSYYVEARRDGKSVKEALGYAYTDSIHAIMTSGLILILVTLVVGNFASAVAAKICLAISQGTTCSILLILLLLPAMLAACDKMVVRKRKSSK